MAAVRTVTRSVTLGVPPDRAWGAVGRSEALSRWLGVDFAVEVRPAATGTASAPGGRRHVLVEEVAEPSRLVFTWWPAGDADGGDPPSKVEIVLVPAGDAGTTLTVTETALADLDGPAPSPAGAARR